METKQLRLSEAIRLGSMMKPQSFDKQEFSVTPDAWRSNGPLGLTVPGQCATCAMGAAIDGAGLDESEISGYAGWPRAWTPILRLKRDCPQCGIRKDGYSVITHLNDHHKWTREQIADWIEAIENAQEITARKEQEHANA